VYFTKVELHNYGIYKGTHEMCLVNKEGRRNVTLVGGLNGRGKTTFHDAILIALYGKQAYKYINEKVRSYEKLLQGRINKHATDEETYVAVSLCLDDGTELRVKRSWSAGGAKLNQLTIVEKNGAVDKYLGENWSYYIEEILPFGIARFFFFNNEKITQLADDASFEQIKSSIKSAIGVSAIEKAIAHTDEVIRRKNGELQRFEESDAYVDYRDVETQIKGIEERILEATRQTNELERRRTILAASLEVKEEEFWASGGDLSRNREAIQQEKQRIAAEMEDLREKILQLSVDAATPLFLCKALVVQSYDSKMVAQEREARHYYNKVLSDMHQEIIDKLVATGLSAAQLSLVQDIVTEVLISQYQTGDCDSSEGALSPMSLLLYERLVADVFQTIAQRIDALVKHVDAQESELMSLDAHLGAADEKSLAMQLFEALKSLEKEKTMADAAFQQQEEAILSLTRQRSILVKRRIQLIKGIAEKEYENDDNARIIKYAAMSIQVLTEFKTRLQKEKVTKLSSSATECFKALVEKESLVSRIDINAETLDVIIQDMDGRELLKNQLSAGEQQMFAISIVWALALTSGYKAPVIIDTPMARLDSAHRTSFVTKYLPAASSQVLVLSTDEEINGHYLGLLRDNVVDCYTLLYSEEEQCTSIIHGYFGGKS